LYDITTANKGYLMEIATEYIKLDSFLKLVGAVNSGGEAKILITEGLVFVNGEKEFRRGRKLYNGDKVELNGKVYSIKR